MAVDVARMRADEGVPRALLMEALARDDIAPCIAWSADDARALCLLAEPGSTAELAALRALARFYTAPPERNAATTARAAARRGGSSGTRRR
jgi:hypothetical protein